MLELQVTDPVLMVAKKHKTEMLVEPRSDADVNNMRFVLFQKFAQHPEVSAALLATGKRTIIEDCSRRRSASGLFWGMALCSDDGTVATWKWRGWNKLGELWMEIRKEAA